MGLHLFVVIPAKAGIQYFQAVNNCLDPGFHRGDDKKEIFSHLPPSEGEGEGLDLLPFQVLLEARLGP